MTGEYGIFNDEAEAYTEADAIEAGFCSLKEAMDAIRDRYNDDDNLEAREIEEADELDKEDEEGDNR